MNCSPYLGYFGSGSRRHLYQGISADGINWQYVGNSPILTLNGGDCADPTGIIIDGIAYVVFTYRNANGDGDNTSFGLISSADFINWTPLFEVDLSSVLTGTNRRVWSPNIFKDQSGNLWFQVTISNDGEATFNLYSAPITALTPSTVTAGPWTIITLTGVTNPIDASEIFIDGSYLLFWKNETAQYIGYATSGGPDGPWIVQVTGAADTFGIGGAENPWPILTPSGYRLYFDKNIAGGCYSVASVTAFSSALGPAVPLLVPCCRGGFAAGNIIALSRDQAVALLFAALSRQAGAFSYTGNSLFETPEGNLDPFLKSGIGLALGTLKDAITGCILTLSPLPGNDEVQQITQNATGRQWFWKTSGDWYSLMAFNGTATVTILTVNIFTGSVIFPQGITPPTADPHVSGSLWNNAGVPTFSAG